MKYSMTEQEKCDLQIQGTV